MIDALVLLPAGGGATINFILPPPKSSVDANSAGEIPAVFLFFISVFYKNIFSIWKFTEIYPRGYRANKVLVTRERLQGMNHVHHQLMHVRIILMHLIHAYIESIVILAAWSMHH